MHIVMHCTTVALSRQVQRLLQLVVALGIVPNLLPGVGLPMEKRSAFFQCLKTDEKELDPEEVRSALH